MKTEKTFTAGAYVARICERQNPTKYPNHRYSVLQVKNTPKAVYCSEKILHHYVYKTLEDAIKCATNWINQIQTNIDAKAKERDAKKAKDSAMYAKDHFKNGDIIVNTWGYEQTNVDWYQVTKVGNKTITIKGISGQMVENSMMSHGMACDVLPCKDNFIEGGKEYQLRVKSGYLSEVSLSNPKSYYYMHKWDGKPKYKSWYA